MDGERPRRVDTVRPGAQTAHMTEGTRERGPGATLLEWAVDLALGALGGLLAGFAVMVVVDRLGGGLWSPLPPIGILAGLAVMRWDRDRSPHPGTHRRWLFATAAVLAVASVVFFASLAFAISRFE